MNKDEEILISGFINHSILVASKFIKKVETGHARSKETFKDLKELKEEAEYLMERFNLKDQI